MIILLLLNGLWLQRACHRCPECPELKVSKTVVPGDSVAVAYKVVLPKTTDTIYQSIPASIDTAAIIRNYFASFRGTDTLANDSSVFVSINWTVSQNSLTAIQPFIANRRPTSIISLSPVVHPKNKLYAGFLLGSQGRQPGFGPALSYQSKNDVLYSISYDLFNREVHLSMQWKIFAFR